MNSINIEETIKEFQKGELEKGFEFEGLNENGEYSKCRTTDDCLEFKTYQKNGWVRINAIYKDGTSEEVYGKYE